MALIKCSECGKEISDKASACPNCGCPMNYQSTNEAGASCINTPSWETVYSLIDNGDTIGAAKLVKAITGASIQEARDTVVLIRNNRSSVSKTIDTKTQSSTARKNDAVSCLKCGKLYYSDMTKCPECGALNRPTTTKEYIDPSKKYCQACNKQISTKAESCPHCGHPTGVHVCPKCNSTNTKVISGSSKATSIFLWGPFAANKVLSQFQCKDCGHIF